MAKIVSLADNLAMSLAAIDVRVEAPIPGKSAIGVEVPNSNPAVVSLRECIDFPEFWNAPSKLTFALGKDVRVCPCKTIVPFYRQHVIAQVKPTTRTRIDFGLALKDTPCTGRLIDTGGLAKKNRITHRIPLSSLTDINDEVKRWLKKAYDMDAPKK